MISATELDADPMAVQCPERHDRPAYWKVAAAPSAGELITCLPLSLRPRGSITAVGAFSRRGHRGDVELQEYLQRVVGYTLGGLTTEEVFFYLYGPGGSGKSTLAEAIKATLGSDYAKTSDFEAFMKKRSGGSGPSPEFARLEVRAWLSPSRPTRDGSWRRRR